jgi:hypothetical protein
MAAMTAREELLARGGDRLVRQVEALCAERDALADALLLYRATVRMLPDGLIPLELSGRFVEAEEDAANALRKAGRLSDVRI